MDKTIPILYVEDHLMSRRVMKHILTHRLGLKYVTIFEDSTNILQRTLALDPKPKLILLDIHMEPLNGFEVLAELKQSEQFDDSLIVAVTASVMNDEIALLQSAGFNGCLGKPIDSDTIESTFDRILAGGDVWYISR